MKSFVVLGLAAAAMAMPQASSPTGCQSSTSGTFQITTVNVTSSKKRDLEKRQLDGALTMSLSGGILKDQAGRTGYIASNYQFQFDSPIQNGARETSGFSLCGNKSLALGSTTVFYQCLSGTFYNLYSQSIRQDCLAIHIQAVTASGATQISDGQPQASKPVSQISDGQPQATTPGSPVVTQISDGQPQASAPATIPVVTQISDGQPQASAPVSVPLVTQISDGQPQASAPASVPIVTQISDGQPQASAPGNYTRAPLATFTGAATPGTANFGALFAGLLGIFALL